jgi:hypothetical protein
MTVDMTPGAVELFHRQSCQLTFLFRRTGWELKLLGGPVTIIGMFEAIDTIVLGLDADEMVGSAVMHLAVCTRLSSYMPSTGSGGSAEAANKLTLSASAPRGRR